MRGCKNRPRGKEYKKCDKREGGVKGAEKSGSFMYGVSAFLVVVIIVIGINLMNNYERMKKLNQSVNNLMNQLEDGVDSGKIMCQMMEVGMQLLQ